LAEHRILTADVLEAAKEFEDNTFDALLSDCPYGLSKTPDPRKVLKAWLNDEEYQHTSPGFMGKRWDSFVPGPHIWKEYYRILKPGAYCLVFIGPRTADWLSMALRLAGFEVNDQIYWVTGQSFPKATNISKQYEKSLGVDRKIVGSKGTKPDIRSNNYSNSQDKERLSNDITISVTDKGKQWDGYYYGKQALKAAATPIIIAQKPFDGSGYKSCLKYGCGGLNIDECRIEYLSKDDMEVGGRNKPTTSEKTMYGRDSYFESKTKAYHSPANVQGRWPANLILDGSEQVEELFPTAPGQQGDLKNHTKTRQSPNGCYGKFAPAVDHQKRNDSGSASRFFQKCPADRIYYCSKVSKKERNAGLENEDDRIGGGMCGTRDKSLKTGSGNERNNITKNPHPTLKPVSLCEYLARLVLPPKRETPRKIVVPFAGTGSEMAGALRAGWDEVIGIEYEEEYCDIAEKRIPALEVQGD
jgi:site-specific DNA-methyltransferase (adenine-specific)